MKSWRGESAKVAQRGAFALFLFSLLGWKHLVLVLFSEGLAWSLPVYPVHESLPTEQGYWM